MKALIISLIAICIVMIDPSFAQWEWQSPVPQGNILYKVQFINSSVGWAIGEYGTLLRTTDGGLTWIGQEYGRTDNLLDIRMLSESDGWTVGDNGIILHTANGGTDWLEQTSGTTEGLNALFFIDSLSGWVVGDKELILHTTNGGATWEFQQYPATQYSINTVTFISPTEGWAAGASRRVYHTTDGGATWTYQMLGPSGTVHLNIYFADASLGFLTGSDGSVMRTTDGGAIWSQVTTGDNVNYNQIIMQNTLVGWIAGDGGRILRTLNGGASWSTTVLSEGMDLNGITRYSGTGTLWMVGEFGRILRSTNNGVSWSPLDSGSRNSVNWIDFSSDVSGTAVGLTGLILRTTDGGASWTQNTSPVPSVSMFGIDMVDDTNGWAVGDEGTIIHTTDGGSWSQQSSPATGYILFGVSFRNAQNGWIAGGEFSTYRGIILHTSDGGSNWSIQYNAPSILFGINFADNLNGWAVGGNGKIYHTTNGGTDWTAQTSNVATALYWCSFADEYNGWAVGDLGTILHTTDGGNIWTTQNSGGSANLFSIAANGILRATVTGDSGTILRTTDGGANWEKQYSRTAMDLFGVAQSTNTWVCGDYGTILQYQMPTVFGSVTGRIINDLNNNGFPDLDEPGIAGWKIQLTGPETITVYSSSDGSFAFSDLPLGSYTLTQEVLPSWTQTMPAAPGGYSFTLSTSVPGFAGNFCNYTPLNTALSVQSGWNLLSFPIRADDPRIVSIFPTVLSSAFFYTDGYIASDSLRDTYGYWMKFPETTIHWVAGTPIPSDTIPVRAGWNIIGSVSDTTDTSAVISEPPDIIISDYYGYNLSYIASNSIKPGKGYWIKVIQDGSIILNGGGIKSTASKESGDKVTLELNSLTITDASGRSSALLFGSETFRPINPLRYELPPLPPDGCFDVRFKNGRSLHLFGGQEENRTAINLHAVEYPIVISWDIQSTDLTQYQILNSADKNKIASRLYGSGNLMIESIGPQSLILTATDIRGSENIPTEFALMQNSPNPFNPETKMSFVISHLSFVKLRVYNIIGEEVATLVNEVKQPGEYSAIWDASSASGGLPSGIYFYRLDATPMDRQGKHYVSTKKMVHLK